MAAPLSTTRAGAASGCVGGSGGALFTGGYSGAGPSPRKPYQCVSNCSSSVEPFMAVVEEVPPVTVVVTSSK